MKRFKNGIPPIGFEQVLCICHGCKRLEVGSCSTGDNQPCSTAAMTSPNVSIAPKQQGAQVRQRDRGMSQQLFGSSVHAS